MNTLHFTFHSTLVIYICILFTFVNGLGIWKQEKVTAKKLKMVMISLGRNLTLIFSLILLHIIITFEQEETQADVDELGKAVDAAAEKLSSMDPDQLENTLHRTWVRILIHFILMSCQMSFALSLW